MHNLTKGQAMDQKAETNLGRLAMMGRVDGFSHDQYEAALRFLELKNDYSKSLLSPSAHFETNGSVDSTDPEAYEEWCKRVQEAHDGAITAINNAQIEYGNRNLWAALRYVVIDDMMMPHMLGDARIVCNVLHRYFMIDKKSKLPNK